uniref:Uncharacterized protein n=1 Tax=Trichogramma kaykai TaxID=54128 RepID=A0ABD2XLF6_9HYME
MLAFSSINYRTSLNPINFEDKKRRAISFNQKSSIASAWTVSRRNTRPYNSVKSTLSLACARYTIYNTRITTMYYMDEHSSPR